MSIDVPETLDEARERCERWAELSGEIASEELLRDQAIAEVNAAADEKLVPLLSERQGLECELNPWFLANQEELLDGKRKSLELGGCILGTRAGKVSLGVAGKPGDVAVALSKRNWGGVFIRQTIALDRAAALRGLDGEWADELAELGLRKECSATTFYIKLTGQSGTAAKVG